MARIGPTAADIRTRVALGDRAERQRRLKRLAEDEDADVAILQERQERLRQQEVTRREALRRAAIRTTTLAPYRRGRGYDLGAAIGAGVSQATLRKAGFTQEAIENAGRKSFREIVARSALNELAPYKRGEGYDIAAALAAGVPTKKIREAGFTQEQIQRSRVATTEQRRQRREANVALAAESKALNRDAKAALKASKQVVKPTFAALVTDTLKEGLTLGKAETASLNKGSLGEVYDKARADLGKEYDTHVSKMKKESLQPTESKDAWTRRVMGSKREYVDSVLKAQHSLPSLAKEVGLASIPIYGTVRTWEDSPHWGKGLGIAADLLFLVPVVGLMSTAVRAGASIPRAAAAVGVVTLKSPITSIRHPLRAIKAGVDPIETVVRPTKIPLAAAEVKTNTIRIPTESVGTANAMLARDIVVRKAIQGEKAVVRVPTGTVRLTQAALQKVTPMAVHATPDIRPFLTGLTVRGQEGGLFVSPSLHTRFTRVTAFGYEPGKGAKPGGVLINDPAVLAKLQTSGKLWQGTAEIESVVPDGIRLPPPKQILQAADAGGRRLYLAVIGKPLTPDQLRKLKFIGAKDALTRIFKPSIRIKQAAAGSIKAQDEVATLIQKANVLTAKSRAARRLGKTAEAKALAQEARQAQGGARGIQKRLIRRYEAPSRAPLAPLAAYYGKQNISRALDALGQPVRGARPKKLLEKFNKAMVALPSAPTDDDDFFTSRRIGAVRPTVPRGALARPVRPAKPTRPVRGGDVPILRPERPERPSTPGGVPIRPLTPGEAPGRPVRPVPFVLPGGGSLPKGQFPHIIRWPQGGALIERNLQNGKTRYYANPGDPTQKPWDGLVVTRTDKKPPKPQRLDLGAVDVLIRERSLRYVASRSPGSIFDKGIRARDPFRGRR